MELIIKRLTKELKSDFFDFFDNRAFTDGSPYYPCYCDAYYLTPEEVLTVTDRRAMELGGGKEGLRIALRESSERLIDGGIMQGYLAFDGDTAIGWCNANDRTNFTRAGDLNPAFRREGDVYFDGGIPGEVKSIVCFEVAPEYRGKGVAKALLERVLKDAEADGYKFAEVYPKISEEFSALDFTGPIKMYRNAGFEETARSGKTAIMRKVLNGDGK